MEITRTLASQMLMLDSAKMYTADLNSSLCKFFNLTFTKLRRLFIFWSDKDSSCS